MENTGKFILMKGLICTDLCQNTTVNSALTGTPQCHAQGGIKLLNTNPDPAHCPAGRASENC